MAKASSRFEKNDYPDGAAISVVAVVEKQKGNLTDTDSLTLTIDNKALVGDSPSDEAVIGNFDQCVIDGLVEYVTAKGVCIEDGNAKNAEFTFDVELSGAYNQEQTYYFEFTGNGIGKDDVTSLTYTVGDVTKDVNVKDGKGEFTIEKNDYPDGAAISVVAVVEKQKGNLTDTDSLTLTIDNKALVGDSPSDEAVIGNFDQCVIDGLVEYVTAKGVCIEDGNAKNAEFTFDVELSGAYNQEQTYYFEFTGNGIGKDDVTSLTYTVGDVTKDVNVKDGKGEFTIEKNDYPDGAAISVVAVVEKQKGNLTDTDSLTLTIDNKALVGDSPSDEAVIGNFDQCVIDGLVEYVTAKGVCIEDGNAKNAEFTFDVELSGAYNQEQTYYFEFTGNGIGKDDVTSLTYTVGDVTKDVNVKDGKGEFTIEKNDYPDGAAISVVAVVEKQKGNLTDTDSLTLTIDNKALVGDSPSDEAVIGNFDQCVIDGLVEYVTAKGVCIEDGNAKNAEFTFDVELSGAYNQEQTYYFEFTGNGIGKDDVTSLTYTVGDVTKDVNVKDGKGEFTIEKNDYPDGAAISVVAVVEKQKGNLTDTDSLTLTIDNKALVGDSPSDEAVIGNFDQCVIDGLVEYVTAKGVCIEDGNAKNAEFTFDVELSGAYNQEQTYYFEFTGNGIGKDDVTSLTYTVGDVTKDVNVKDGKGEFTIEKNDYPDGAAISVVAVVEKQKGNLTDTDSLTLTIDNKALVGDSPSDEAVIGNFDQCVIDGLVEYVTAKGVCN